MVCGGNVVQKILFIYVKIKENFYKIWQLHYFAMCVYFLLVWHVGYSTSEEVATVIFVALYA
jgi:hypothetical protein